MTVLEIKEKEKELIQEIDSDATLLDLALRYIRTLKQTTTQAPCQYSVDELKDRLKRGRTAAKTGAYKSQAEMRSKHAL